MKKIKNFNYDVMGCFKTPDLNFTVLCEYEDNDKRYHSADYDMNIMVGTEEKLLPIYEELCDFLSNLDEEMELDVMLCGLFLNGDNSMLFASDGTYEFENMLLSEIGIPTSDYIRETHCYEDIIKEEYPELYSKIKDNFLTW
jgi:hypothetical protein